MTSATSHRTRTTFILGASHGIGLEMVEQYRADGWHAIATAHTQGAAHALQTLSAEVHVLDLTDANVVAGLAWKFGDEALGVAIYVAGIHGPRTQDATSVSQANFGTVVHTNMWAPTGVLPAVLPMVEAERNGADELDDVLTVISSRMDNIGDIAGNGGWLYHASKATVNAVLRGMSIDARNATCLTFHPGWVQTGMDDADVAIMLQESVAGIRHMIAGATHADNNGFHSYDDNVIGW